ncbi:MAG: glycosyltransferase family 2 protein [Promethearchaeota archaeon]
MDSPKTRGNDVYLSVVIPLKNEERNIPVLVPRLVAVCRERCGERFEVVCVDDGSTDRTLEQLANLRERFPRSLRVFSTDPRLLDHVTVGIALAKGLSESRGEYVVTMDGDLSHEPERINSFLDEFERGKLVVIGGRYARDQDPFRPASRYFISKLFNFVARFFVDAPVADLTTGFRGFRRDLLELVHVGAPGFEFHLEINKKLTTLVPPERVAEIPIRYRQRASGRSKMKYWEVFWRYFTKIISR